MRKEKKTSVSRGRMPTQHMDEKGKKTSVSRGRMPTQHMDEKGEKTFASRGSSRMPTQQMHEKSKTNTCASIEGVEYENQYMDEKWMRLLPPWWNFRVSIGQNMCNIQY
jgi:hypothetical protein